MPSDKMIRRSKRRREKRNMEPYAYSMCHSQQSAYSNEGVVLPPHIYFHYEVCFCAHFLVLVSNDRI